MNDMPDEPNNPSATDSMLPASGEAAAAAEGGDSTGSGKPRRRRSRPKRGGSSAGAGKAGNAEASQDASAESGDSGGEPAPRPARLDPALREVAGSIFEAVVSGAHDQLDAVVADRADAAADDAQAMGSDAAAEPAPSNAAAESLTPWGEEAEDGPEQAQVVPDESAEGEHRRVLAPDPEAPKLHKVLAQSGAGSRRDLEAMIEAGRVTVNGEVAHTGQRVSPGDRVAIDGKPVRIRWRPGRPRVIAYHKPVGEVVTHDDPQQRPTVFRRLPRLPQGKWQSVGRLDLNTEGLLLFTNSGELANQLMHPRFGVEREYAVRVLGRLGDEGRSRLLEGVDIEGQRASFISIEDGGGEGVNHWYRVVLNEGRNREVRRLFDAVGLTVSRLIRIRYGCVVLPRGLKRGAWVDLGERDVLQLQQLTGVRSRTADRGRGQGRGASASEGAASKGPRDRNAARDRGGDRTQDRPPRRERRERGERGEEGPIPNPLQQTFDKRAFKEQQRRPRQEYGDDGPIPNPLQQTFDQRALKEAQRRPRREFGEDGPIPNPLQQTYDKRALQEARRHEAVDDGFDDDGPIPNPLQQTFDKRFVGKGAAGAGARAGGRGRTGAPPRGKGPAGGPVEAGGVGKSGGRGKAKAGAGRPAGRGAGKPAGGKGKGPAQPDPMRTAVGYIGADAAIGRGAKSGRGRRSR